MPEVQLQHETQRIHQETHRLRRWTAEALLSLMGFTGISAMAESAHADSQVEANVHITASVPSALRDEARSVINAGHRGNGQGRKRYEDTIYSCNYSLNHGSNGCEADSHETKDHHAIVLHGPFLQSTTNCHGRPSQKTLAQLRHCFVNGNRKDPVPTLVKYMQTVKRRHPNAHIVMEIKDAHPSDAYMNEFAGQLTWYGTDKAQAESFHASQLLRLKQLAPEISRLLISNKALLASQLSPDNFNGIIVPYGAFKRRLANDASYVSSYTNANREVFVWGDNTRKQIIHATQAGVNSISNEPLILARLAR